MDGPGDGDEVAMGFLRRPKWLLGHVLVAAVLVTFPLLGVWQLDRHREHAAEVERLEQRADREPVPMAGLDGEGADATHRPVVVHGTYLPDREWLLWSRSRDGRPGHHVLTLMERDDAALVVVDRGWVPFDRDDPPVDGARPPDGEVRVEGQIAAVELVERTGRDDGRVVWVSGLDPDALDLTAEEADRLLADAPVRATGQHPPGDGRLPVAHEPLRPEPDPTHLSYAVQWWGFTAIVALGYPLLIWRTARERRRR